MNRPRIFIPLFLFLALVVCALPVFAVAGSQAGAQQSGSQELYETAKRHYESGAYRQALEAIEDLLKRDADYAPALFLKYKALIGLFVNVPPLPVDEMNALDAHLERKIRQAKLLKEAADSLEKFLQLKPDAKDADLLRDQLNSLRVYAEPATKPEAEWTIVSSAEVTEKAHIQYRPEPRYPEESRAVRESGRVKLLVVLAADGTVKNILVLKSASPVLTKSSIEAASRINFEPAIKDRHPVATAVQLEYQFQTY